MRNTNKNNELNHYYFTLKLSLATLFFTALAGWSHAAAPQKLKVAYVEFPPIEYKDKHDQPAGSFINITKTVLNHTGLEYEFVFLPISRAYLYLKDGKVDMWPGLSDIPALQGHVIESTSSPLSITLSAWYLNDTAPINTISELKGTNTILINGYTYGGLRTKISHLNFGMKLMNTPNHLSGLQMLERHRGDYLLDYNEPINAQLRTYPVENLSSSVLNKRDAAFIVSKKAYKAQQLINQLDHSFRQLVKDGTIKPTNNKN